MNQPLSRSIVPGLIMAVSLAAAFMIVQTITPIGSDLAFAGTTATSTVVVGNAAPTVTVVTMNNGTDVTLTTNTTTNVSVNATISDNNGCGDVTGASASTSIVLYRSGVTSSTCRGSQNALNCYLATAFTASSTCASNTTNTTTTFAVQYFAQATDASSSFPGDNWQATVIFKDTSAATGTADSLGGSTPNVLTLNAINVTTSSVNYGTLSASSTSGSANQVTTSTNAGNSTTTIRLSAQSTLTSGANSIVTSSQRYATSTFTFPGGATQLTESAVTVTGYLLTAPTSTGNVQQSPVFWGLEVAAGTATGTYSGVNLFTSLFQP